MTKRAIILAAGQGSRLLPLTADRPKCLIDFNGRTLLRWQIDNLLSAGIKDIHVVTGFNASMIDEELRTLGEDGRNAISTIFNPFYNVADNLGSVWLARHAMDRDFLILNGDTLVSSTLVSKALAAPTAAIRVTIDKKPGYDSDDMRVELDGERLLDIGKRLPVERSHAESIGLLRFQDKGRAAFRRQVEDMMSREEGLRSWYLRAIHYLARDDDNPVLTTSIEGEEWGEVDFLRDVDAGRELTANWS
ncbi:MAG: phosphocholine cytidylyltransferase family protein [Pacificimonas sp.]